MAKIEFIGESEVKHIVEEILKKHGALFDGFDIDKILFIRTMKKRGKGCGIKVYNVKYPYIIRFSEVYVFEVFDDLFATLTPKQKNLAVFHSMSQVPTGGFDPEAKAYGKRKRPDITMFMTEFAASGGVPNWLENPGAHDPLE